MIRKIVRIDEEKCSGCGACAKACHEGAIGIVDGKARLLRDDYCDGLGDCLPACPENAISFETREAAPYDEAAVNAAKSEKKAAERSFGCPGAMTMDIKQNGISHDRSLQAESKLAQWPVQIRLAPVNASYFKGARLLIAADCTAYSYGDFHREFMDGRITLIGCPKLDSCDYSEKLSQIIKSNGITDITVVRMEVPCCGGIEAAVKKAAENAAVRVITISTDGRRI